MTNNSKKYKCLRCDKLFKTTPEFRVCSKCKERYNATFDRPLQAKQYGDMGVWENKDKVNK